MAKSGRGSAGPVASVTVTGTGTVTVTVTPSPARESAGRAAMPVAGPGGSHGCPGAAFNSPRGPSRPRRARSGGPLTGRLPLCTSWHWHWHCLRVGLGFP